MPGFLSPGKGMPLLLIPEYSAMNKGQRVPDRAKTAHRKPLVKCFLTDWQAKVHGIFQARVLEWCQEAFNKRLPVCCFGSVRNPLALINNS